MIVRFFCSVGVLDCKFIDIVKLIYIWVLLKLFVVFVIRYLFYEILKLKFFLFDLIVLYYCKLDVNC